MGGHVVAEITELECDDFTHRWQRGALGFCEREGEDTQEPFHVTRVKYRMAHSFCHRKQLVMEADIQELK